MKTNLRLIISLAIVSFLQVEMTQAQESGFHYGGRFGIGESSMTINGKSGMSSKLSFSGGVATCYQFNSIVGITADFLFTSKGAKAKGSVTQNDLFGNPRSYAYSEQFNLFYAELPVAAKLSIPLRDDFFIKGFAGPSMNFKLLGMETREYDDESFNANNGYYGRELKNLETIEYSIVYGAGIDVVSKDNRIFFLDFRLSNALGHAGTINYQSVRNNYFMISAGYLF